LRKWKRADLWRSKGGFAFGASQRAQTILLTPTSRLFGPVSSCWRPHVVGEIGKADLYLRPGDSDCAHNQDQTCSTAELDFGFVGIGNAAALRHRPAFGLLAMDARDEGAWSDVPRSSLTGRRYRKLHRVWDRAQRTVRRCLATTCGTSARRLLGRLRFQCATDYGYASYSSGSQVPMNRDLISPRLYACILSGKAQKQFGIRSNHTI
jgi:hypothetical protein